MVEVNVEIDGADVVHFERMCWERGRSLEDEIQILLNLLIQDPKYLTYLERKALNAMDNDFLE